MARFAGTVTFALETPLTEEQIRQACARAAAAGQRAGKATIHPTETSPAGIRYVVRSRHRSPAQLTFVVTWQETVGRRRRVHLIGEKYVSNRPSLLWTPAPQRNAPTMRTYRLFADTLRRELATPSAPQPEVPCSSGEAPPRAAE